MTRIVHNGVVIDQSTQQAVEAGLRVEAWDAAEVIPDMLGYGVTDEDGRFTLVQTAANVDALFGERRATAFLRVLKLAAAGPATVVAETKGDTNWDLRATTSESRVFADLDGLGSVDTLAKLVVRGVLNHIEDGPVDPAGISLRAFDVRLQSEVALATAAVGLDARGRYRIEYAPSELGSKVRADLQVRAYAGGAAATLIAQSEVQCGAPPALVLDLITDGTAALLPADTAYRGPVGEAETTSAVTPHLDGAALAALSDTQVERLACTAGIDAARAYALRDAEVLATATSGSSLTRGVFYGLIRQGVGPSEEAMFSVPAAQLRRTLAAAVAARDTAHLDEAGLAQVEAELIEHQVTRAFMAGMGDQANLGDMVQIALDETGAPTDAAKAFVRRYARRDGESIETFWFLPPDLKGLILWLRADRGIVEDGGEVESWSNQSAGANKATAGIDKPSYLEDAGAGLPGVVFDPDGPDRAPEHVTIPFSEASTSYTVVVRMLQGGSGYRVALSRAGSPKLAFFVDDGDGSVGVDDGMMRQAGATADNGEHTYAWVIDGDATRLTTYVDGAELGTASVTGTSQLAGDTVLGKEDGGASGPIQSILYEVLVFNRALEAEELQRVHDYVLGNPWLDETREVRDRLQLALQWGALARHHQPMIARLEALRAGATATSLRDLATFTKSDWDAQVAVSGAPADIPGADEAERRDNYARLLTRTMEQAMFTAHLQGRVAAIASPSSTESDLVTVLGNPANAWFELGQTRVATFARTGDFTGVAPGAATEAVIQRLQQYERLHKLSDDYELVESFRLAGLDSAHAVSKKSVTQLMAATSVSAAAAEHMSKAAKCQSQRAMHLWALFHANLSGPRMNVVPDYTASSSALTAAERDDWESMFGRLTLCRCEHCRSVYSAAAYLVDMLQFLDGFDSEVPNITAKEYLIGNGGSYLGRRPDIRHIALSCENTNTTLPYVDLVNELLERHVAGAAIPTPIQTDASSAELLATPQILAPSTFTAAYDLLSGETSPIVYPWSLPYSLWQHQARIYLEHLGTTRAQLMELLQRRFAPGDVPGCVLWLRADVGVSQAEGRVTKWRDLSGRGYALVPVEGELGPFHRPAGGSNDQPHVHFAGSELLHVRDEDAPALDLSEEVTVVVITSDLGPSDAWVLSKGASGPGHHYGVAVQSGNLTAIYDGTTQMGPSWGAGGGTAKISVTTLSTERTEWRVDGVEAAVDATHTIVENDQPLYLGARATGAAPASFSDHLAGRVYEILVYDGALRPSDVAALEAYAHERYGAALTPTTGNTPSSLAIAQERLGMSAAERALIVANPSSAPWAHWGFASSAGTTGTGDWSADLTLVGTFLAQSDIGYDELRELLDGRFMLDWAASPGVQPTLGVVPGTSGCHVDEQRIVGLGSSTLPSTWNAVQRFLRLRRRLGWEIRELDKVLTALTGGGHALDDALVASLGDVVALTEHPRLRRVPRAELAAYWADLDTQPTPSLDEPSFFDSVYRSKALSNPAIFDVVEGGRIDDHLDDVLAGLVTTATELRLLIDGEQARRHLELLPAVADRRVTLSNLSRLYRIVAFARRLRRPISEILVMQALTGINALTGDAATPATPATPRDTRAFLAELDAVAEIGMRIPELHYLLRHVIQPGTGVTGEIAITESRLHQLDLALEKVVAETAYAPDPDGAAFVELLTTELTRRATELSLADAAAVTAMAQAVVRVLDGTSEDTPEDQKQLLRDVFGSLIADIEAFVSRVVFEPATDLATCALWLDAEDIVADQARRLITWPSKVGTHTARPPKPTDLPGCTLWLRATADDVTTSSGARIDTWSDRAGTNHATQLGDDTHKPTFGETSGYGGQPGIELDGSDDWLDIPGLANPGNDHTVLVVLHQRAIDATQHLLSANTQGTDELNLAAVVSAADPSVGFDDEVDTRSVASAKLGDQILTWVFDATAGTGTVYRDGSPIGAGPAAYGGESLSAGSVALGRTNDTSGGYFAGAISEVVVFNRALPPDELRYLHGAILAHYARGSSITGDGPFELKALQLSGDDDLVIIDAPGFTFTSQTVVAVVRQDALPDDAAAVPLLEASTGRTFAARTMGTTKPGFYDGSSWFSIGADEDASVGDRILTWVIDDDVDQVTLYRNGAAVDGASSVVSGAMLGNLGLGGMGLGALGFGSDVATFPGAIALLGVFDTHLSDADLARVHHHLYQRTRDARRYEHAHQALLDEVRRTTSRNTVVDTLSTALDLPAESTEGLVHRWLTAVSDPNQPLIADLLPATHTTTEAAATTRFQAMVRLDKAARIVHALDLDAADIEALQGEDRDPRWLRLDELPVTSRAVARFDIDQTAVRDGRVSLPSWLSLTCETEGRTTQVGPSTVVSGLPAHAARAMSRDGVIWGLLVEPATTNAIGASNHDLNNWQDSGSPSVATAVGPDGVAGPLRLTDESTTLAEGKYLALGPFGGGTFSLWIHDEGGHARAFLREGVGGATLSANLDGPSSGWALLSDSADYGASDLTVFLQPRGAGMEDDMGSSEFALVQLEAGSYPTSFIQATRAAEVLVADLASLEGVMRDGYFDVTLTYAPLYAHDEATTKHDLLFIDETHRILYSYSAMAFLVILGDVELSSATVTFARDQSLTIRVVHGPTGLSLTVSGATTGNGTVSRAPAPPLSPAPTVVHVLGGPGGAQQGARLQVLDFGTELGDARLRYRAFMALARAAALRDTFRATEGSVFKLLAQAKTTADLGQLAGAISTQTGWLDDDVSALFDAYGWRHVPAATSGDALHRLAAAQAVLRRLGASAAQALGWLDVDEPAARGIATAEAIVRVAKAKYGEERWPDVGRPLRDAIRDAQRDALVAYMLQHPPDASITSADTLYEWLLVDVEMSPCALTSRIVQANGSIQLFVQRCLMNLEPDVALGPDAARQWAWMKNYRVWEANRKVFLYPENWMEPDWRDDRTPLFEKVESILRQGPLDEERTTLAYRTYVSGLVDIAKLDPAGITFEQGTSPLPSRWHILGRSPAPPHRLYHRMWVDGAKWTPWVELDVDATRHLLLYSPNNRPTLVWAEITGELGEPFWSFEVKSVSCSHYEFDKWQAPRRSTHPPVRFEKDWGWAPHDEPDLETAAGRYGLVPLGDGGFGLSGRNSPTGVRNSIGLEATWGIESCERRVTLSASPLSSAYIAGFQVAREAAGWDGTYRDQMDLQWWGGSHWLIKTPGTHSKINYLAVAASIASYAEASARPTRHFVVMDGGRRYFVHPAAGVMVSESPDHSPSTPRTSPTSAMSFGVPNQSDVVSLQTDQGAMTMISAEVADWEAGISVDSPNHALSGPEALGKLRFETFYHPHACSFARLVDTEGVKALARWDVAAPAQDPPNTKNFGKVYKVNQDVVATPYPKDDVDFSFRGAYAVYNWELFFHLPFLIATRLMEDERYEEARKWLHLIFDPTEASEHVGADPLPDARRFWKVRPLRKLPGLADLQTKTSQLDALKNLFQQILYGTEDDFEVDEQLEAWREEPFRPFVVARMRPLAFQKTTVLRYIENLVRWGDKLFRRDTLESVNEATQLYVLAKSLLGDRPIFVDNLDEVAPKTYDELEALGLDSFSNAFIEIESLLDGAPKTCTHEVPPPMGTLYFCVPQNEKLLGLWDLVEDRLFKLRHCMNIEGVVRQLPLFEPPIDPALLVAAVAAGLDISSVLDDLAAPRPHYRYGTMYAKAVEVVQMVTSFGASLLGAIEKQDGEALALLRQEQEIGLLELTRQIRKDQIKETKETLESLEEQRKVVEKRRDFYRDIEQISGGELAALSDSETAMLAGIVAQGVQGGASAAHAAPDVIAGTSPGGATGAPAAVALNVPPGGSKTGASIEAAAAVAGIVAQLHRDTAAMTATTAGYQRRWQDWKLQEALADQELKQIDKQIAAANIRIGIAEQELRSTEQQRENAKEVERFLKTKFSNERLYTWQKEELSEAYYQAYRLAYRTCKAAEQAYRYERGEPDTSFIRFGYWDSRRQGLVAGEKMLLDLRRMDAAYMDNNRREYEITKSISLSAHFPEELLELRRTGSTTFDIPEALFDLDYPGHYMRRIKSASITVPAVAGPYDGVHCTLTLLGNRIRASSVTSEDADYAEEPALGDSRFIYHYGAITSVCTSTAQADGGQFDLNFRDERFLPFEGAGAISRWRIDLPHETNRFDVGTITDVILQLSYMAREGGAALGAAAKEAAFDAMALEVESMVVDAGNAVARRLIHTSLECASEWGKMREELDTSPGNEGDQVLNLSFAKLVPFLPGRDDVEIARLQLAARWADQARDLEVEVLRPSRATTGEATAMTILGDGTAQEVALDDTLEPLSTWQIRIKQSTIARLGSALTEPWRSGSPYRRIRADALLELFLVVDYVRARSV